MKGKSKSKKILDSTKPKVSIENMYKKYKSQESYSELKIFTRNFPNKINVSKQNIVGISPTNNNMTNNSNTNNNNLLNINTNTTISNENNPNKFNKKVSLKLKNIYETTNSTSNKLVKMISPNNLKSNVFTGNNKNIYEKLEKNSNSKKLIYPITNYEKIGSEGNLNKNKLTDNSFDNNEINCEKKLNFVEEFLQPKLDSSRKNLFNENEKKQSLNFLVNNKSKQLTTINNNKNIQLNNKIYLDKTHKNNHIEIKSRKDTNDAKILEVGALKNSNNFFTKSICEATESFIEKGEKNLINNVPDTFVRQTENRLMEKNSSKNLINIKNKLPYNNIDYNSNSNHKTICSNNYHTNPSKMNLNEKFIIQSKRTTNEREYKSRNISDDEIIDTDSQIVNIKEEEILNDNLEIDYSGYEDNTDSQKTPKIKLGNTRKNNYIIKNSNENEALNSKLNKTSSANKILNQPLNKFPDVELTKNFSDKMKEITNLNTENNKESQKEEIIFLSPIEKCYKKLQLFSKKGDKECFLETLSELYSLEGEKLNIHFIDEITGKNILHIACEEGNLKIVEILVKLNFNLDMKTKNKISKKTALHISCENGYFDISKILVEKGAEINLVDADLNSSLHICALNGHVELFQFLLEKSNIKYDLKNSKGETAFDLIFKKSDLNKNNNEKFKKIIKDFCEKNDIKWKYHDKEYFTESSPRKNEISKITNNSSSNNSGKKISKFIKGTNTIGNNSIINEKIRQSVEFKKTNEKNNTSSNNNSNKKSSKDLNSVSNIMNNLNTINTSNVISDLSTNINNFSKKESSNISSSQFSNFKLNFKNYKKTNQQLSNVNSNVSNSLNNFSIKNLLNSNAKNSIKNNSRRKDEKEPSNKLKTINFNMEDLSNSSKSNIKVNQKIDISLSSNNFNSNNVSSNFKKIESADNISSDINNFSNNSNINSNDFDNFYANLDNSDCLKNLNDNKKISASDFICHMILGKGSFGEVYLVQEKETNKFFAMKLLKKEKIIGIRIFYSSLNFKLYTI